MQPSCTPFVNLARKPAPMASPSQNQSQRLSRCNAFQKITSASAQKKTLNESIVIRIEPTAIIGMTDASSRHHNATRSSYNRRASRKSRALVPVLKITAKKRMPKTVLPNNFVPSAMVQRDGRALCRDMTRPDVSTRASNKPRPAPVASA